MEAGAWAEAGAAAPDEAAATGGDGSIRYIRESVSLPASSPLEAPVIGTVVVFEGLLAT